jgi:hypothetical protein
MTESIEFVFPGQNGKNEAQSVKIRTARNTSWTTRKASSKMSAAASITTPAAPRASSVTAFLPSRLDGLDP